MGKRKKEKKRYQTGSIYFNSKTSFKYQNWIVDGRKTASHVNLYKIALERFTQLIKKNARVSILVPDNFATDNGSTGLRHLIIDRFQINEYLSFSNRKKIFSAVDERFKFACLTFLTSKEVVNSFKAFFYRTQLEDLVKSEEKLDYSIKFLKEIEPERYAMIEAPNQELFNLFKKIRLSYKPLGETKLFRVSDDFNKTKYADRFINWDSASDSDIPLYEGKFMNQFTIFPDKLVYKISEKDVQKRLGDDYKGYRIVFRRVASSTNQRSLIATLLPPNVTSTNSIFAQRDITRVSLPDKLFIVGILNSYVIDFVLRQLVQMTINYIYLKQLPIPSSNQFKDADNIIQIVKELLQENKGYYQDLDDLVQGDAYQGYSHDELIAELNARVMLDFNLTRQEVVTLMHTFESAAHKKDVQEETQRILDCYDKLSEDK